MKPLSDIDWLMRDSASNQLFIMWAMNELVEAGMAANLDGDHWEILPKGVHAMDQILADGWRPDWELVADSMEVIGAWRKEDIPAWIELMKTLPALEDRCNDEMPSE